MAYTYKKLAEDVLKQVGRPLTAMEIWQEAVTRRLNENLPSVGKTPWQSIGAQIYVDMRNHVDSTVFCKVPDMSGYFFLKELTLPENYQNNDDIFGDVSVTDFSEKTKYYEKDLHKLLVTFMHNPENFDCECLTIHETNSSKGMKGQLEWSHPDIVGVHFYYDDYNGVYDLIKHTGNALFKLYSFELKKQLSFANIKESYFQAVSNSSWANEGYLVALKIDKSENFRKTLRRLSNSFGIGIIELDPEHVYESQILFPAHTKDILDWDTIHELSEHNVQFRQFIENIIKSSNVKDRVGKYDGYFESPEEASEYAKSKGMF